MGIVDATSPRAEPRTEPPGSVQGWGPVTRVVFRFAFTYWLLYSLPVILQFPGHLVSLVIQFFGAQSDTMPTWLTQGMSYLGYPSDWLRQATGWFVPPLCQTMLGVTTESPTNFTGSGDRLFDYCTCFTDLVFAIGVTVIWTAASELGRRLRHRGRPNYDWLNAWLIAIVRFHLMYQMIIYGAMKVWCGQFPPISDGQLEAKYGDSSPMGLLWRFMQFSQPYTSATGIIEFICGILLICRRTTLLGALCSVGATLQVFLLNMCYDVPVKLMSGHLLLLALTLIVPHAKRLASFFLLGRPAPAQPPTPLFGRWPWLDRTVVILRTAAFGAFAALMLYQAYESARSRGILAPENPTTGRWVGKEFVRDGQPVPFPEQPENPPPRQVTPSKWQGGPGIPAVVRVGVFGVSVTLMFEDGSGLTYRNTSRDRSEFVLSKMAGGGEVGRLRVSNPEADTMVLEGPLDGQDVRMTLRKAATPKRDYLLRNRGFNWVQETPFNR